MNKWLSISLIILLVGGVVALGVLYSQESGNLREAESTIDVLESDVATLEADLADAQAEVASLQADLAAARAEVVSLETDLSDAQAEIDTLESDLADAQAQVATLQADLATAQADLTAANAEVSRLEGELTAANAQVATLQADLATAQAEVSTLQADLTAAQAEVSTLTEELIEVKDPRHFNSLTELMNWLEQDDTDEEYADENIYNYVYILQIRALRDGYLLPANFEDINLDYFADVAGNLAYIGDQIYLVWPFGDAVELWFFAVDVPSHPLPLD